MNSRPHLMTAPRLWDKFESRILEITSVALVLMRTASELPEDEKNLNQILAKYIRKAMWMLRASDPGFDHAPHLDASNQPDPDDSSAAIRDDMRPDFQWELKNEQARTREEYQRFYAMECKRLGAPSSPSWVLNKQYVTDGIKRFTRREYSYGSPRSNPSASMIGYIQNMKLENILLEVNYYCAINRIAIIRLSEQGWQSDLTFLHHLVSRPEIHPLVLHLQHLWLDLRSIPIAPKKPKLRMSRKKKRTARSRKSVIV